jgi:hypothetical protein
VQADSAFDSGELRILNEITMSRRSLNLESEHSELGRRPHGPTPGESANGP